jgi:hypothetical protein
MPKSQAKKYLFRGICAIITLTRKFGFKSRTMGDFHRAYKCQELFCGRGSQGCRKIPGKRPLSGLILALYLITRNNVLVFCWTDTALNVWCRAVLPIISSDFCRTGPMSTYLKLHVDLGEIS